ncbi:ligand-gated channel protein [Capsulimonas corticalis]|uniref:Ligand-gated channel protein n=1 Tax=Capsulimonas corticalis TaxID=2219043 RepID=A0A402D5J5_9BACT|nr:TonB-dependent receptor [Capsulimonas corticalis]BDI29800.1 ligand-gated channel protein [Capsulimonas corticalis]
MKFIIASFIRRAALLCASCCAFAAIVLPAHAQSRDSSSAELLLSDEPMVFTASKKAQRISDTPSAVTVITRDQIQASEATTLPELLRGAPGVDVIELNRSNTDISLRGTNNIFSNKILVMVDGRSIYQDSFGGVFWNMQPILISQIDRIEIVRGPGATLYGANALAGVINIITQTPDKVKTQTRQAAGEQNSLFSEALVNAGDGITVGAAYRRTAGYNAGNSGYQRDDHALATANFDVQRGHGLGTWRFTGGLTDGKTELSTPYFSESYGRWRSGFLSASYRNDGAAPYSIRGFFNGSHIDGSGAGRDETYDLEAQQQRQIGAHHSFVYGADLRRIQSNSSILGASGHGQNLWALYVQDEYQLASQTTLFGGLRVDTNSSYGTNLSPRLSLVRHLTPTQTARISYGSAFRAPTLLEMYLDVSFPTTPELSLRTLGNPNSKPEELTNLEAGYRIDLKHGGFAGLSVFHYDISRLLEYQVTQYASPAPGLPAVIPVLVETRNGGGAHAQGAELETEIAIGPGVKALLNYSYQDIHRDNGMPIYFAPKHKGNIGIVLGGPGRWNGALMAHIVGAMDYDAAASKSGRMGGHTSIDAAASLRVGSGADGWRLGISATNLLGKEYIEFPDAAIQTGAAPSASIHPRTCWFSIAR